VSLPMSIAPWQSARVQSANTYRSPAERPGTSPARGGSGGVLRYLIPPTNANLTARFYCYKNLPPRQEGWPPAHLSVLGGQRCGAKESVGVWEILWETCFPQNFPHFNAFCSGVADRKDAPRT